MFMIFAAAFFSFVNSTRNQVNAIPRVEKYAVGRIWIYKSFMHGCSLHSRQEIFSLDDENVMHTLE